MEIDEMMIPYEPPEMLKEIDDDVIHMRMMDNLPPDIDTTQGGFAHDFTRPAAIEKADMMIMLNETIQMFFPAWSYGVWLDQLAMVAGLKRRGATPSTGVLRVTGIPGTEIPQGTLFAPQGEENLQFESQNAEVIGDDGVAEVTVQCTTGGAGGNVPANSITVMAEPISGISGITNEANLSGGIDEEDDESLRDRVNERNKGIDASYAGSVTDYRRWAREVPGVGEAICTPEWNGPGTVLLTIVDQDGNPASKSIQDAVRDHIMGTADGSIERKAPIGATLEVVAPVKAEITVKASVVLAAGYTLEDIQTAFRAALEKYMVEAAKEGSVRYARVGSLLDQTAGVADYTGLKLNGGVENITLESGSFPSITGVTLDGQ